MTATLQAFKAANGHAYAVDPATKRTFDFGPAAVAPFHAAEAAAIETVESLDALIASQPGSEQNVSDDPDVFDTVTAGEALPAKKPNRDEYAQAAALDYGLPVEFILPQLNPAESDEWEA